MKPGPEPLPRPPSPTRRILGVLGAGTIGGVILALAGPTLEPTATAAPHGEDDLELARTVRELERRLAPLRMRRGDLYLEGANLVVDNGTGDPLSTNGRGNLIVGYLGDADDSGSHNVVLGSDHAFPSFGGLVTGENSAILAGFASVTAGRSHVVDAPAGAVAGGVAHHVAGPGALATGGCGHSTGGVRTVAAGGRDHQISTGAEACAVGGLMNRSGSESVTVGGALNDCGAQSVSIGGSEHFSTGTSVACGGSNGSATGLGSVFGGQGNTSNGGSSTVGGGRDNTAMGGFSSVSGGFGRSTLDLHEWRAGSLFQDD